MRKGMPLMIAAVLLAAALSAAADEGVLLRYKWQAGQQIQYDLSIHAHGSIGTAQGPANPAFHEIDMRTGMPLFLKVEELGDDGTATVRVLLGLMTVDMTIDGQGPMHTELDPVEGKVRAPNGQEVPLPPQMVQVLREGIALQIDPRGQVKKVLGAEKFTQVLSGFAGRMGNQFQQLTMSFTPLLPEGAAKPGAEWKVKLPMPIGPGAQDAIELDVQMAYKGIEERGGVRCHKLTMVASAEGVNHSSKPPEGKQGLAVELTDYSVHSEFTYWLSAEDCSLVAAEGTVRQDGTVHATGQVTIGQTQQPVDTTMVFDGFVQEIAVERVEGE